MIKYTLEKHIKDREVYWYEMFAGDELIQSGEVDTAEETMEEHELYLQKLVEAITDKERIFEGE